MRKAEALEQTGNGRVVNSDPFGIGKRIAQLEQGNVGVLGYQFTEETGMGSQLSAARWTPHWRNTRRA